MEQPTFHHHQRKFVCDGRESNCTIDSNNISINFLETSFFSIFDELGNRTEFSIPILSIVNLTKINMGFCVHYVTPKLKEKQGITIFYAIMSYFIKIIIVSRQISLVSLFFLLLNSPKLIWVSVHCVTPKLKEKKGIFIHSIIKSIFFLFLIVFHQKSFFSLQSLLLLFSFFRSNILFSFLC